jgi:hypothetical protein
MSNKTFVAPVLGAATATSINGLIITSTLGTLTIPNNAAAQLITSGNFAITLAATNTTSVAGAAPTAHAASHGTGQTDAVTIAPAQVTGTAVVTGDSRLSDARTPTLHASSHGTGQSDAVTIAPAQVTGTAVVTGDSRLSDTRNPKAHNFVDTTGHPVTGLTTGQFLKATSATAYAFGAHGLIYTDVGAAPATGIAESAITGLVGDLAAAQNATGWIATADAWTYASATTITVPSGAASKYSVGMRVKFTQGSVKYFIIVAVADTLLTVFGGDGAVVATPTAISAISYSTVKIPLGFPASPASWTIAITPDATTRYHLTPTQNTWYELDSTGGAGTKTATLTLPAVGLWRLMYEVNLLSISAASKLVADMGVALSTSNSSVSDPNLQAYVCANGASSTITVAGFVHREITTSTGGTYYLIGHTEAAGNASIDFYNYRGNLIIQATCAYV